MKRKNGNKVKLGIFVSISILLFTIGIYFIGQKQQLFGSTFKIYGIFKDISGLQVGNNVRYAGINVGVIQEIKQITDTTVKIDMAIDEHSRKFIKKNAKAIIGSDGLMGNKIILIIPGAFGQMEIINNDTIETASTVNMDEILNKIKVTADNAANITSDLSVMTENIRNGKGTIGKLIMDSVFAETVDQALINIKQGAGGFKQNMNAASHNILLRGFFKKKTDEKEKK